MCLRTAFLCLPGPFASNALPPISTGQNDSDPSRLCSGAPASRKPSSAPTLLPWMSLWPIIYFIPLLLTHTRRSEGRVES